LVLKRAISPKTGKLMTVLSVDEIRRLADFFGMTSGAGGWRVAIVDTADDMNDNAANALLKMLEEPPPNAMLLLLSNLPGRLLPTIRSRCQRLELRAHWMTMTLERGLAQHLPDADSGERAALARLSGGSLGAALMLATGDGAALAKGGRPADRQCPRSRPAGAAGAGRKTVPHPRRAGAVRQFPGRSADRPHPHPGRMAAGQGWNAGSRCWGGSSRGLAARRRSIWNRGRRC
jgi:hypothetical protein